MVIVLYSSKSIGTFCCWEQTDNFGHKTSLNGTVPDCFIGFVEADGLLGPAKIRHKYELPPIKSRSSLVVQYLLLPILQGGCHFKYI